MGQKLSIAASASVSSDRTGSRRMMILGVLLSLCAMVVFLVSDRTGSSRKPPTQRQTPSPSFAASENGNEKSSHPLRQREAKSQEPHGKPPQAFLGGATSLNDDASAFLGVT